MSLNPLELILIGKFNSLLLNLPEKLGFKYEMLDLLKSSFGSVLLSLVLSIATYKTSSIIHKQNKDDNVNIIIQVQEIRKVQGIWNAQTSCVYILIIIFI